MHPPAPTPEALRAAAAALCADPRMLALLQRLSDGQARSTELARDDAGLLQALADTGDPRAAVSQSLNLALQWRTLLRRIVQAAPGSATGRQQWLEFDSGHTHLARFFGAQDAALELKVCEASPDSARFVAQTLGAPVFVRTSEPEAFDPGQRFDGIWAPRLFSRTAATLWRPWLARLKTLLVPGGQLCLGLPPQGHDGVTLDAMREAWGEDLRWQRIARGLSPSLDLVVITVTGRLPSTLSMHPGICGWVDQIQAGEGRLRIQGWASTLDSAPMPWVEVRLGKEAHRTQPGLPRTDVAAFLGDERHAHSGWTLDLPMAACASPAWLEVTAHGHEGSSALLLAGPLGPAIPAATGASTHVYHREIDTTERSSLSVLSSLVPPGARVLDLGTGSGVLGKHLHERQGCEVDGVTLNADEQAAASNWYRQLVVHDLEDPSWIDAFADRRYDRIVCADVLEHLRQPERVLGACAQLLQPGGQLLISIPNVSYAGMIVSLMHGQWKDGTEGLLDRTHLRFFTRQSFSQLLRREGWHVERVEAIEMAWFLTEFWTPFDHLPPAVARYLLAQPDASAYQLVFAAQRSKAPASGAVRAAKPPAPDPSVNIAVYAATLYAGAGPTGPLQTTRALGRIGLHRQTLRLPLAAGLPAGTVLRLDPADRPGLLHLHAIVLRDQGGQVAWQWRAAREGLPALASCRRHQIEWVEAAPGADHLLCHLQGDDPQIDLPLPVDALSGTGPWVLEVDCGWPLSADYLALQRRLPHRDESCVEIVLPVYGGLGVLQRCVASVLAAECRVPWHLTVIDDASPQPEVAPWLRELAFAQPLRITVLTNARNQGFVGTVNLGMRLAGRRDVVLLNSDTEVAGDWLDRLSNAAYGTPRAGTVTPFSNNATICSHPRFCEDNPLPAGHTVASLDRLFAQVNAGRTLAVPTAVGFCMYIRRECLDEVGEFDAQTFGAGYGEENDFCVRASAAGWLHLHALDVFVFHAGAVSFNDSRHALQQSALAAIRRLHPHYEDMVRDFVQRDPAGPFREAVSALIVAQART